MTMILIFVLSFKKIPHIFFHNLGCMSNSIIMYKQYKMRQNIDCIFAMKSFVAHISDTVYNCLMGIFIILIVHSFINQDRKMTPNVSRCISFVIFRHIFQKEHRIIQTGDCFFSMIHNRIFMNIIKI